MSRTKHGKISRRFAIFFTAVILLGPVLLFPREYSVAERAAPKRANYYLAWEISDTQARELAKWDLLVLDMEIQATSLNALKKIRQLNPAIKILAYITPQEIKQDAASGGGVMRRKLAAGIDERWYLTDTRNNKITFWPGTWMLNVADNAPPVNGIRLNQYIAQFVAREILATNLWDGVFYDNAWKDVKWLTGDLADLNKDGQPDSDIDAHWREGMRAIYKETRRLATAGAGQAGDKYLILGNATSDVYKNDLNGIMLENFPPLSWEESMRVYSGNQDGLSQPRVNLINANTGNKGNSMDFRKFRYGLASALLLDGYYSFDFGDTNHAQTWWYDEYDVELGKPIASAVSLAGKPQFKEDVWRREYENGIALVNSTPEAKDVDLGGEYEKIKGKQDYLVNDGSIVNHVNLAAKDGLVMLRVFQALKDVMFANGNFVQFLDKNGQRVRNGLFVYEKDVLGGVRLYHGDLNGDGKEEKIVANGSKMEIFNSVGGIWFSDYPFGRNRPTDLRVTVGKLSGKNEASIIVSQNNGGQAVIYNYHGAVVKEDIFPLGRAYGAALSTAIDSQNGRIIVGASGGRLPEILIFDANLSKISKRFFVDNKKLTGELSVAVGDVNGDKIPEIIAALNAGRDKRIKIYTLTGKLLSQFKVASEFAAGAVRVAAADVNFDGVDEVLVMSGQ